ncbi:MAG: type IV pilus secretin PilQ [Candidatus Brocadiales bacterium]|nr:type IV pilus secretin PilQ [Candidatus Brocadiales bacterium]
MKIINKFTWILLLSISFLLTACSTVEEKNDENIDLLSPEQFVEANRGNVERSVSIGPKVDLTKEELIKTRQRRRINVEEPQNYIDINDNKERLFSVTANFENVEIRDVMSMLSEITEMNVLVGDEVEGKVTAHLIDVPWDVALDSILKIEGLAKHVDSDANIIRIHKQDILVAQEEYDRRRIEDLKKSIAAQRSVEPLYTEVFSLYYTEAKIVKGEIEGVLGGGSSSTEESGDTGGAGGVEITIDERLNSLIVKATEDELELIARLIGEIDIRTQQILIEAFIVEADDDFKKELGSRLGYNEADLFRSEGSIVEVTDFTTAVSGITSGTAGANSLSNTTGNLTNLAVTGPLGGVGFLLSTSDATLKAELTAMETEGLTKILSNPRVFTLNNQEAIIKQGWEIPYKTEAEGGGTDIEFKEAKIVLTVTPSIVGDGNIIMDVSIEKNDADETVENPPLETQEITTKLMVKDKTIVVIGGVRKRKTIDSVDKVPFFGDLPLVGGMFRHKKDQDKREELLVFLAPRII